METLRDLWNNHKALVIAAGVALVAVLIYVYTSSRGNGVGSAIAPSTTETVSQLPDASTEQYSTILAKLGQLTPVTNTLQPIETTTNNNTTITNPVSVMAPPTLTTTLTTPDVPTSTPDVPITTTTPPPVVTGIGNDTARDAAILAAQRKYWGPQNAAALAKAIDAIKKQYPRSGPTI